MCAYPERFSIVFMTHTNPADSFLHVFSTFLGIPPDTATPPVCGAALTAAYDFPGVPRKRCPTCERILRAHNNKRRAAR